MLCRTCPQMYWCNPVSYGLKALVVNEFLAPRWDKPVPASEAAQVQKGYMHEQPPCLGDQSKWLWYQTPRCGAAVANVIGTVCNPCAP